MFTETDPDKGTKTLSTTTKYSIYIKFTETDPDKGTKTTISLATATVILPKSFTETDPDKGTKTSVHICRDTNPYYGLQKLTPIRGRKRTAGSS